MLEKLLKCKLFSRPIQKSRTEDSLGNKEMQCKADAIEALETLAIFWTFDSSLPFFTLSTWLIQIKASSADQLSQSSLRIRLKHLMILKSMEKEDKETITTADISTNISALLASIGQDTLYTNAWDRFIGSSFL